MARQLITFIGCALSNAIDAVAIEHKQGVPVIVNQETGEVRYMVNKTTTGKLYYNLVYRVVDNRGSLPAIAKKNRKVWANEDGVFPTDAQDALECKGLPVGEGGLSFYGEYDKITKNDGLKPYNVEGKTFDYTWAIIKEGESRNEVAERFNEEQVKRGNTDTPITNNNITKQDELAALRVKLASTVSPQIKADTEKKIAALELELGETPPADDTPEQTAMREELAKLQAEVVTLTGAKQATAQARIEELELALA